MSFPLFSLVDALILITSCLQAESTSPVTQAGRMCPIASSSMMLMRLTVFTYLETCHIANRFIRTKMFASFQAVARCIIWTVVFGLDVSKPGHVSQSKYIRNQWNSDINQDYQNSENHAFISTFPWVVHNEGLPWTLNIIVLMKRLTLWRWLLGRKAFPACRGLISSSLDDNQSISKLFMSPAWIEL